MPANRQIALLDHYRQSARDLPWRYPPGHDGPRDPYRVWLSEIMLQQTSVATVTTRFARFLERWPTVEALAAAPLDDLLAEWAGLGYYARARNLHACAQAVVAMGGFPDSEAALRQLPGIGDYSAAAIAAIAFGRPATVIDTNVERVIARLHALDRPVRSDRKRIRALADDLYSGAPAGEMAQALMDLGATICRPANPACHLCPLSTDCAAYASGDPASFPPRPPKKVRPERFGTAWWIRRDDRLFLVRRPARGMLGGMAALPGPEWQDGAPPACKAVSVRHVFTHFALTLRIEERDDPSGLEGWWHPLDRLDEAGLPTLYARAAERMLA
ncbi:A/G-specific adenine glycosylase [Sphingomicrobium lutaoense]|uniref:Adenine DNA glycosylase n=1 Tax=Sphingomicrobium lutaoense TaxID=515949 RepID=A0A839Z328_9SPHN|nr:A/G-specific adenine glycosylase [Sphingomicrobium lutaoense]MBB3764477.1 A/G-specific adenine glycosylase [Sphingomicrobium lutaoense]